jgi:cytochrome b subunit of formate dehydrogenase
MANGQSGVFVGSAGLVWRRQRVLWWVFVVNLILASFAARTITSRVAPVLNHSLASIPLLVQGFHVSAMDELGGPPAEYLTVGPTHVYYSVIFFFFMLLATGGRILSKWRQLFLALFPSGDFSLAGVDPGRNRSGGGPRYWQRD